jgi:DNA-binding Xre family transcriptional regulator
MPNRKVKRYAYWTKVDNSSMLYDKEKIDFFRVRLKLSWNELARRAGISGPSMNAISRGKTKNIRAETLLGIANALGVKLQDILKTPKGKHSGNSDAELMAVFAQLDESNKQAVLAAAKVLAAQQKKK